MAIWITVYVENWKRREATIAFLWGMTEIDKVSVKREQINADYIVHPILGTKKKTVVYHEKRKNQCRTFVIILIGMIFAVGLYLFNRYLKKMFEFCCN
mmetsp:Transcript_6512/g.4638  ORF Transcript_6512/g.4638 Transcript_6512/m.4638 type:complete len:98 (+) Transcript_6512:2166-2459(+)